MTTPRTEYPSTVNNPTLEGFAVHYMSQPVEGVFGRTVRAVAVSVPGIDRDRKAGRPHVLWQEQCAETKAWRNVPGWNDNNSEALIVAMMCRDTYYSELAEGA